MSRSIITRLAGPLELNLSDDDIKILRYLTTDDREEYVFERSKGAKSAVEDNRYMYQIIVEVKNDKNTLPFLKENSNWSTRKDLLQNLPSMARAKFRLYTKMDFGRTKNKGEGAFQCPNPQCLSWNTGFDATNNVRRADDAQPVRFHCRECGTNWAQR